jgi:hypothetical protein
MGASSPSLSEAASSPSDGSVSSFEDDAFASAEGDAFALAERDAFASTEGDAFASTCSDDFSAVSFESSRADRAVTAAFSGRGFFLVRSCGLVGRGKALLRVSQRANA